MSREKWLISKKYCSKECQTAHWKIHKLDCKNPLRKSAWRPAWEVEKREPHFIDSSNADESSMLSSFHHHGGMKYLWGNVPALDLLQLDANEGENTAQGISLLLAASGDLRNLVKTIANLPEGFSGSLHIDVNDRDEAVVARNLILLLIAFNLPAEEASVAMLHLWYSAFLAENLAESIQAKLAPIIQEVLNSKSNESRSIGAKALEGTWSYNRATLSAELPKKDWEKVLPSYLPGGASSISFNDAAASMKSITLAHSRRDYRDRAMFALPPSWRLAHLKFRGDGVLLPFSASRETFKIPNATFFQGNLEWSMPDSANPLDGWKLEEILQTSYGAKDDVYGQLYLCVKSNLQKFCEKLATLKLDIRLFRMDAADLPYRILDGKKWYDRIELSNIADWAYLGPGVTLSLFGPLLKPKGENPKATLLVLFLNATHEMTTMADAISTVGTSFEVGTRYLHLKPQAMLSSGNPYRCELMSLTNAQSLFREHDTPFDRFVVFSRLREAGECLGLGMKSHHTIVEKWPMRLKKNPSQREFDLLFWTNHVGSERYVEWHRTR
ncbi:hypothetical protein AJ80_00057 [Polytolypa hystricis UAMH7299]|uniref:Uncharacterized protein n=1 Tax=Polytolypa hystricis (strain UAMH7299) TaxID=1447883 RepID=A0A2B7Z5N9_POLH7|nr:hypothetical protein AJ80_00057 [Polytolypa hystricis UAMH7299]